VSVRERFFAEKCPTGLIGQRPADQFDFFGLGDEALEPEHAGQLNFYLAAADAQIKAADDKLTIGLLLCKTKNRLVAEYAISGISKPIGVVEYQLVRALPEPLDTNLPSIEELEAELSCVEDEK